MNYNKYLVNLGSGYTDQDSAEITKIRKIAENTAESIRYKTKIVTPLIEIAKSSDFYKRLLSPNTLRINKYTASQCLPK